MGISPDNIIAARRRIEQLAAPAPVRARSFSIYVGLIERADPSRHLSELAAGFLADFGINRGSWSTYRRVLLEAELTEIGRSPTDRLTPDQFGCAASPDNQTALAVAHSEVDRFYDIGSQPSASVSGRLESFRVR